MENKNQRFYGTLGVGLFLLLTGIFLLLNNFEIFYTRNVWDYWPIIIIAIGLGRLFDAQYSWEYRKAVMILFWGAWFLISELHIFGLSYRNSWPIILIGIGISILWKSLSTSEIGITKERCHGL